MTPISLNLSLNVWMLPPFYFTLPQYHLLQILVESLGCPAPHGLPAGPAQLSSAALILPWLPLTSSLWVSAHFCLIVKFIRACLCVIMWTHVCVCMHEWVDRIIGPANVLGSARAKRCCAVQCGAELSWGGVGKRSQQTSEGAEEEWGNCIQIGLMVVLSEEVAGPTAASHPSERARGAALDRSAVTYPPSGDEHTGTFHQSRVNRYLQ